jgi:cell division protein FtsW
MLISRSDRGPIARWWFTLDWPLVSAFLLLLAGGIMVSMAASPSVAERIGADSFHFITQQITYAVVAVGVLLSISFLSVDWVRRIAMLALFCSMAAIVGALLTGPEIKGAHRWINIGPFSLQPSEFAKPAFVVAFAWFLTDHQRRPDMPGLKVAIGLFALLVGLLILEPDFGQAALVVASGGAMLLIYGMPWLLIFGFMSMVGLAAAFAYNVVPHVASRVDRFLNPDKGDTFQIDTALDAFRNGGLMGTGPGGGEYKLVLPDAHTDLPFAVVGEEFGTIACVLLMSVFLFIVVRVLARAKNEPNPFLSLSQAGLVTMFGLQACINMGVSVALLPAKGMTLPFISYGGSSLLGTALAMGFVLALGRKSRSGSRRILFSPA